MRTALKMNFMDLFENKYLLMIGGILTPFIGVVTQYGDDFIFLMAALLIMISLDTAMGVYISMKKGKFESGDQGFWKVGDKMISYFGLIILVYTIILLSIFIPSVNIGIPTEILKFIPIFVFSVMYAREVFSILEKVDLLQPKLLPSWLKERISNIFRKDN